jgi:hypothetical protein
MRTLALRRALSISVAAASLAGCGALPLSASKGQSEMPPIGGPGPFLGADSATGEVQWVSTFYNSSAVVEYDYPKSESPIGQITNLVTPSSECTNGFRTFWVATRGSTIQGDLEEFTAGGRPIKTLKPGGTCAVDPATGDVAVLVSGKVVIFKGGRGSGKTLSTGFNEPFYDGYDSHSNLFADGFTGERSGFTLVELRKGSSTFRKITPSNTVQFPGSVQSDGTYLTVFDQLTNDFYQYAISGKTATLKGTVALSGPTDCLQTWIAPPYVYCADAGNENVTVYKYPAGGSSVATLDSGSLPAGVVSLWVR